MSNQIEMDKQIAITRAQWDMLSPDLQGWFSYYQAVWNHQIPDVDKNPYLLGSKESNAFRRGAFEACMEAQEGDD